MRELTHLLVPTAHSRSSVELWRRLETQHRDAGAHTLASVGCKRKRGQREQSEIEGQSDARRFEIISIIAEHPAPLAKRTIFCADERRAMWSQMKVANSFSSLTSRARSGW